MLSSPLMQRLGVGRTEYTEVAARLLRRKQLPVTLKQAERALK